MKTKLLSLLTPLAALSLLTVPSAPLFAASHREAPITALDQKADITDWFSFVDPNKPDHVVFILNVDPFLEPTNGPNYFPFDPNVLYEMKIDNNHDGVEDIVFQFRFTTQITSPQVFTGIVGGIAGIPPVTSLSGAGAAGLNLSQTYSVTMLANGSTTELGLGQTLYAVPTNVGPRTMPNYPALAAQGIYNLGNSVTVFAGTVADPFFIDLGAFFDSINLRTAVGGGVLPANIDGDDHNNYAPNALAGFNVNSIVLEVPITMLTADGLVHPATDANAVIGSWGTTSRAQATVLTDPYGFAAQPAQYAQVQRMGNPLINEGIIGTGAKDTFSMSAPKNDSQFASYFLNPLLATVFGTLGIPVAPAPRTDLLPLVQYIAPICPGCTAAQAGPIADLLRLNTGIAPTPFATQKRLGFLAGDNGFPNGRRLVDDVLDIAGRTVAGILVSATKYGTPIGDGVNTAAVPLPTAFPFEALAYSGRQSSHNAGPGQPGCSGQANSICPTN